MPFKNHRVLAMIVIAIFALSAWASAASKGKLLHTFGGTQGAYPGGLVSDSSGNLYGLTTFGGLSCPNGDGCGTIFELSPIAGGWTFKVLFKFSGGMEGYEPGGALIFDAFGNLYGVNSAGGRYKGGTAFELSPNSDGSWSETTLYSFGAYAGDALSPQDGLIFDDTGNLYGTTPNGGANKLGVVFQLTPGDGGDWTETLLYTFSTVQVGGHPHCSLVFDDAGNLYGTTLGSVFELSPTGDGSWNIQALYSFDGKGVGEQPLAGVIFGPDGNLYGTTSIGRLENAGTVFELSLVSGSWIETILHSFRPSRGDGGFPIAPVAFDATGKLYGTTSGDDNDQFGYGTAFQLTSTAGVWAETKRYSFSGGRDGAYPAAGVIFDASGNLYGTAQAGGVNFGLLGYSVVFQAAP